VPKPDLPLHNHGTSSDFREPQNVLARLGVYPLKWPTRPTLAPCTRFLSIDSLQVVLAPTSTKRQQSDEQEIKLIVLSRTGRAALSPLVGLTYIGKNHPTLMAIHLAVFREGRRQ
jgi:hypothetical protein